ncbi:MAG: bifunctional 4-hydroxy-2-oxoglutarate aldolase/2-dehydro-3-deoxy-phosphogluconate aldolase [Planctomycetota bacterium]
MNMNPTRREKVVQAILKRKVSAIIRTDDQQLAAEAMSAAVDGGFEMIEFTLTTPGAMELISTFSKRSGLLVGAGTVMTAGVTREAVSAGASFIVSPICDPTVVAEAARLDVASIPGAITPTEMEHAYRFGADFVKVFPEPPGGVDFIRAIRGPLPHLRLFPTAGVTPDNFIEWLDAGCVGVGFVRSLFEPNDLKSRNFLAIRSRATKIMDRLRARP